MSPITFLFPKSRREGLTAFPQIFSNFGLIQRSGLNRRRRGLPIKVRITRKQLWQKLQYLGKILTKFAKQKYEANIQRFGRNMFAVSV